MNYELARQLKERHFIQSLDLKAEYYVTPEILVQRKDLFSSLYFEDALTQITTNFLVYKPKLTELIDACGAVFDSLHRTPEGWTATGVYTVSGKTPEEAVALLWLEFNK